MSEEKERDDQKTEHREKHTLDKMTVNELREVAKEIPGVAGVTGMKKEQLLEIVKRHRGIEDERPAKKKVTKVALTVEEMKHKIVKLKADKKASVEKCDKRSATVLRRRIARLKKRIRKTERKAA